MKKIFGLIFLIVAVLAIATVAVSAETYIDVNFDDNDMSVLSEMTILESEKGVDWDREIKDGALHVMNTTSTTMSQTMFSSSTNIPRTSVMQFDFMSEMDPSNAKGYIMMNFYRGGEGGRVRVTLRSGQIVSGSITINNFPHTPGVWYTYYLKTYDTTASLFRKVRGSDEAPILLSDEIAVETGHTQSSRVQPYGANGTDIYLDNISVYADTFVEETELTIDGAEVSSLSDIDGGILEAKIKLTVSDYVTEEIDGVTYEAPGDAAPILVVYDRDRKMIYSEVFGGSGVRLGKNEITATVDTSAFADKLEGGYLGFYLWDSFGSLQPVMDAIEIK